MTWVFWDWQQVSQMLRLIVRLLRSAASIGFVQKHDITIDPLVWCNFLPSLLFFGFVRDEPEDYAVIGVTVYESVVCVCMHVSALFAHATPLIVCGSLLAGTFVNSKELLPDLPPRLFCVMSRVWARCSTADWQAVIKKSNTWPHLHWTDETEV